MAEYQEVVDSSIESLVNIPSYTADLIEGALLGGASGIDIGGTVGEGMLDEYSDIAGERSAREKTSMGRKAWTRIDERAEDIEGRSTAALYIGGFGGLAGGASLNYATSFAPAVLTAYLDAWNSDTLHSIYDSAVLYSKSAYNGLKDAVSAFSTGYNDYLERNDEVMNGNGGVEEVDEMLEEED